MNITRQIVNTAPRLMRGYAAASTQRVEIPLALNGLDGKYATALYTAAAKKNALSSVETDLKQVLGTVDKDKKIQNFLENPSLSLKDRQSGVKSLLASGKYSDITKNFFNTLAENGRLKETSKIVDGYLQLMQAHRGEIPVIITSSKELDSATLTKLKDILNKSSIASKDKKLLISNKVNPAIIAGLVIEFGDNTIDLSAATKIAKLNKAISDTI